MYSPTTTNPATSPPPTLRRSSSHHTHTNSSQQTLAHLERFTRAFVSKAVQAIVQSRIYPTKVKTEATLPNRRIINTDHHTESNRNHTPSSPPNYQQTPPQSPPPPQQPPQQSSVNFNVTTRDDAFITSRLAPILSHLDVTSPFAVYVKILLRDTSSSSSSSVLLPLEIWTISSDAKLHLTSSSPQQQQQQQHKKDLPSAVFSAMGLMLKSILCVTRVTQTYKICRMQHSSTYLIEFNIDTQQPNNRDTLGHKLKLIHIGKVPFFLSPPPPHHHHQVSPDEPPDFFDPSSSSSSSPMTTLGLSISLAYRTELVTTTTTPNSHSVNNKLLIKSDHYSLDDGDVGGTHDDDDDVRPAFFHFDDDNPDNSSSSGDVVPFINLISPQLITANNKQVKKTPPTTTTAAATTSSSSSAAATSSKSSTTTTTTTTSSTSLQKPPPPPSPYLPFAGVGVPGGTASSSANSGSSASCSDLLTLFEEFRVAPPTLASFTPHTYQEETNDHTPPATAAAAVDPSLLVQFEEDLHVYDDFVRSLLN